MLKKTKKKQKNCCPSVVKLRQFWHDIEYISLSGLVQILFVRNVHLKSQNGANVHTCMDHTHLYASGNACNLSILGVMTGSRFVDITPWPADEGKKTYLVL